DSVKNRIDEIITGVGNALQRVKIVHQFLVNGISGAGWSTDPSVIGRLNPVSTAPASSMGGSVSSAISRLDSLQQNLQQPIMESFIPSIKSSTTAVEQFAKATTNATSQIDSMIK